MKKLFKWSINTVLSLVLIVIVGVLFLLNSTEIIKWAADRYAPEYGFDYSKISGGLLTGLEIKDLRFQDDKLADSLQIRWNAIPLLYSHVAITYADVTNADVGNITKMIATLTPKESNEEPDDNSSFEIPLSIGVSKLHLSIKPLSQPHYSIQRAKLDGSTIRVDLKRILQNKANAIEVGSLALQVESNLTQLSLEAMLAQERVTIKNLSIRQIDTLALTKLFTSDTNTTAKESNTTNESNRSEPANPLIPKEIFVQNFDCSLKSAIYEPVVVESLQLNGSKIIFDIPKLLAKQGDIDINASTSFATLIQNITIDNNRLKSHGLLKPLKKLYETYEIPLKAEAIESIPIEMDANQEQVAVSVVIDGKNLLQAKKGEFNIEALHLSNKVHYYIAQSKLDVESDGNISTPYAKNITLDNLFHYGEDLLKYSGHITPNKLEGIDDNYTKPLKNFKISFEGNASSIVANINSDALIGKFVSPDFKKAELNLATSSPLHLNELITLPEPLKKAVASLDIHIPLNFAKITPLKADANISSNIANIDAKLLYDKDLQLITTTTLPPDTLLKGFGKEINFKAIEQIKSNLTLAQEKLNLTIASQAINSTLKFDTTSQDLYCNLKVVDTDFIFSGNLNGKITLNHQVVSLQELMKNIQRLYTFEPPALDGDLKLSLAVEKLKDISLQLDSKSLLFKADRITSHELNNTALLLHFAGGDLTLDNYATTFQKQKIFATKPSKIEIKESNITISPLWLNDELQVTGFYDMQRKKGAIGAYANPFTLSHKMIDLSSLIDIQTKLDSNKTDIEGTITLEGGDLHIDMDQKSFASDSDIVIAQYQKEKQPNTFMDNLTMAIKINSNKPLRYQTDDADIKISTDMLAQKSQFDSLNILGTANIQEGSYYRFQNKKFIFKKSIIAFVGNINKPILDIKVLYRSINYEITIHVTGDPQTPNIIFSSIPRLSREQILSVILFDSENAGDGSSGDDMMKMMGGAMAKSVLSNIGIKIDHLSLGTDGSMEIGKKISDDVTIIYVNGTVPTTKLQYDYGKNVKAVISASSESSAADIIYKKEF